jgi:hypothetical protein
VPKTITATAIARKIREVLKASELERAVFQVERHGRLIAEIGPTAHSRRHTRWGDVEPALLAGPQPDADFSADIGGLVASTNPQQ